MADLVTEIRDRLVDCCGWMRTTRGYNFNYDSTSINPEDGDISRAYQSGDTYSDIFPLLFIEVGDETRVAGNAYAVNAGHIINDIEFNIVGIPFSDINDLDTNCNKIAEDLKRLLFADPELRGVIFSDTWDGGIGAITNTEYVFSGPTYPIEASDPDGTYPDGGIGAIVSADYDFTDGSYPDASETLTCKAMFTQYEGNSRLVNTENYINTAGGVAFRIKVRYGQMTTNVRLLK